MQRANNLRTAVKIYGPAFVLYSLVAFVLLYPLSVQAATEQQVKAQLASLQRQAPVKGTVVTGHPSKATISRLGIDLPVEAGRFDTAKHTWSLDDKHLFVSTYSSQAPVISTDPQAQPLKTVFYGHNIQRVLEGTKRLVVGDILTITTAEGASLTYAYAGDTLITPETTSVLHEARGDTPVALITCNGMLNQMRRVMYFRQITPSTITNEVPHHE